jgi:hypothetical protein
MQTTHFTAVIAQSTGGDHLTEDACFAGVYEHHAVIMAADGAPVRLHPVNSLNALTARFADAYSADVTPSGVAARLVRDTVARRAHITPCVPPSALVEEANTALAETLCAIYGALDAQAVMEHEPTLTLLAEEPRAVRLALPACTYTIACVDRARSVVEFAHGADSALLAFMRGGEVRRLTPDQMRQHDDAAKRVWLSNPDQPAEHAFFRARGVNRGREIDLLNGLYHNYIDAHGQPNPAVGVSVVDGLPEMHTYMVTGTEPLADIEALLVVTDGMFLPVPPDAPDPDHARLHEMRALIEAHGLAGYIEALRAEEVRVRAANPLYRHDDASGVLLRLG